MKRIQYQTDDWGGTGEDYIEVQWQGQTVQITISDDCIKVHACGEIHVSQRRAINVVEIMAADEKASAPR